VRTPSVAGKKVVNNSAEVALVAGQALCEIVQMGVKAHGNEVANLRIVIGGFWLLLSLRLSLRLSLLTALGCSWCGCWCSCWCSNFARPW